MGLLDFKVDVVLARLEADCSDQPPSIPAVPNHQVSLQCLTDVPNRKVSLQCPTTKYPCCAQLQSIPAVANRRLSLRCRTAEYPCSAQPKSIPAVPKRRVSLECPTIKYHYSCSAFAVLQGRQLRGGQGNVTLLVHDGFRVGMLEVNNLFSSDSIVFVVMFCEVSSTKAML